MIDRKLRYSYNEESKRSKGYISRQYIIGGGDVNTNKCI